MLPVATPQLVPASIQPSVPDASDPRRVLERVRSLEATSARRAELTVLTAEGDRVTLVAGAETSVTYRDALLRQVGGGQLVEARGLALEQSHAEGFGMVVEGELSREELRDLTRLAKKIKKVITSFVRGDVDQALARAGRVVDRFGRLDSLAGFGLRVQTLDRVVLSGRLATSQERPSEPAPLTADASGAGPGPVAQPVAEIVGGVDAAEGEDRSDGDEDEGDRAIEADSDGDEDERGLPPVRSDEGRTFGSLVDQIRRDLDAVEDRHPRLAAVMPRFLTQVLKELDRSLSGLHLSPFLDQVQLAVLDRAGTGADATSERRSTQLHAGSEEARQLSFRV